MSPEKSKAVAAKMNRTAPEMIADELRLRINGGEFGPGDRLPAERELAVSMGVARLTLREALRILTGEGYLASRRGNGGGNFVTNLSQPRSTWIAKVREDPDWIYDLIEFRKAIEIRAVHLAATRRSEAQLAQMRELIAESCAPVSRASFRQADHRFHLTIAEASGSRRLSKAVSRARGELFASVDALPFHDEFEITCTEHGNIADAIERRDSQAAQQAMERHLDSSLRSLIAFVDAV